MKNTKQITCANCGELLQWFEVQDDGTCPICNELAQPDNIQLEMFSQPVQIFMEFTDTHSTSSTRCVEPEGK